MAYCRELTFTPTTARLREQVESSGLALAGVSG